MPLFRKVPVVIEAIQFLDTGEAIAAVSGLVGDLHVDYANPSAPVLRIETLEGVMTAQVGDWIIKGVKGECYPCKPDIFNATYVPEV